MNRIDKNTKREELRKDIQPIVNELMDRLRDCGMLPKDAYFMMDAELTDAQRESKEPIGTMGYYRMYRWECLECGAKGKKMPYSEMQTDAIKHNEQTGHKMQERGGVFPKGELYK